MRKSVEYAENKTQFQVFSWAEMQPFTGRTREQRFSRCYRLVETKHCLAKIRYKAL